MGYLVNYSCVLGLQKGVKKYYVASGRSYEAIKLYSQSAHDHDLSGFTDSYFVPLVRTEKIELIIDGCQYERTQKTERISDWDIARKYLSPCDAVLGKPEGLHNCSKCYKCLRTLIAIEALGKLEDFFSVFDLDTYRKQSFMNKCDVVLKRNSEAHQHDDYNFCIKHGLKLPSPFQASMYFLSRWLWYRGLALPKKILRKIIGDKFYDAIKHTLKR